MPLNFPTTPGLNEIYTFGDSSWIWDGSAWKVYGANVSPGGITGSIQYKTGTGGGGFSGTSDFLFSSSGLTATASKTTINSNLGIILDSASPIYIGDYSNNLNSTLFTINDATTTVSVSGLFSSSGLATLSSGVNVTGNATVSSGVSAAGFTGGSYKLTSAGVKTLTGTTYTFLAGDNGTVITHNNGSGSTFTVPTGLPVGYSVTVIHLGAGGLGFTSASGVTLTSWSGKYSSVGQYSAIGLISYASNIFNLAGGLT